MLYHVKIQAEWQDLVGFLSER
ncbi:hypothetical protein BO443_80036 [Burkholderia orbicola]